MRFKSYPKNPVRPITKRRLSRAEAKLRASRERYPLLSDWIAALLPSAQERLEFYREAEILRKAARRQQIALDWRRSRQLLRTLPTEVKAEILQNWNNSPIPGDASYFADFVWRAIKDRVSCGELEIPDELNPVKRLEAMVEAHLKRLRSRYGNA